MHSVIHLISRFRGHKMEFQLSHITFVEIDHEITSTGFSPSTGLRRTVVSYWWKYVHKYWLTTKRAKLVQEKCE